MEFIFETFFEIYIELMMYVVPEEKATSKKYRVLTILIAGIAMLSILALFVWGGILLFEDKNWLGLIPIFIAVVLSVAQIILGFILHDRKNK